LGPKAFEPLTLDNLQDDTIALGLGVMTLVPFQDPSGRSIVYWDPSHLDSSKYPIESMIRAFWYVLHAALEPTSAQQHGIIVIVDPQRCSLSQVADSSLSKLVGGAMSGVLPLRLSGIHIIHPPFFVNMILPVIKVFMPTRMQQRILFHSGTNGDVLEKMQTQYGLPPNGLPSLMGGSLQLNHQQWLQTRREQGK
jgi:CRAL/TRIO domain